MYSSLEGPGENEIRGFSLDLPHISYIRSIGHRVSQGFSFLIPNTGGLDIYDLYSSFQRYDLMLEPNRLWESLNPYELKEM